VVVRSRSGRYELRFDIGRYYASAQHTDRRIRRSCTRYRSSSSSGTGGPLTTSLLLVRWSFRPSRQLGWIPEPQNGTVSGMVRIFSAGGGLRSWSPATKTCLCRSVPLGIHMFLVMYAGKPSRASHHRARFEAATLRGRLLISAACLACGVGRLGAKYRLPRRRHSAAGVMGVTFASVGRCVHGGSPDVGLLGILRLVIRLGAICAPGCSIYSTLASIPASRDRNHHPGIGISVMRVGINCAGGGLPTLTLVMDGVPALPKSRIWPAQVRTLRCSC